MRFTLTYVGPLPPKQRGISVVKKELRKAFAPQLEEQVKKYYPHWPTWAVNPEQDAQMRGYFRSQIGNTSYDALVTGVLKNAVELDVLLMTPPHLARPGDGDNRLKTLIDGLTRPVRQPVDEDADDGPGPVMTLLDDDSLVRRHTLDSREWLGRAPQERKSLVVVHITIINDGPATYEGMRLAL